MVMFSLDFRCALPRGHVISPLLGYFGGMGETSGYSTGQFDFEMLSKLSLTATPLECARAAPRPSNNRTLLSLK